MWNIIGTIIIFSVLVIVSYAAFFRRIEEINEQPEPLEDNEGIDYNLSNGVIIDMDDEKEIA